MGLFSRRRRHAPPAATACVVSYGPDPIGAAMFAALAGGQRRSLAGFASPNPAGWGERGAPEVSDSRLWASPQAFNGEAGLVAIGTWAPGGGDPVVFPDAAADYGLEIVAVPQPLPSS